jgi:cell division protein FtsI (penicillin-binding protein 3)
MKIFSAAAALESAGIKPNDIFYCEKGRYRIGSNVVHDVKKHEWLSLQQIIKYSSNIGAVKVAEKTGRKKIYHNLRQFGFGERTGIDAPGEVAGVLTHYSRWSRIDVGAISFGHGLAVTALQLVRAVAAIANDGVLMKPYLVKAITDSEGSIVKEYRPVRIRRVVTARTAQLTRNILKTVITEGGTGVNAALEGYTVCGKTGTARKLSPNGTYDRDRHIASFVGMAPADQPAVAVLVVIDEPQGAHYGGTVAAPVFKKIIQGTLPYLNIAPQSNQKRMRVGLPPEVRG